MRPTFPLKEELYKIITKAQGVGLEKFGIVPGRNEPDVKWLYGVAYNLDPQNYIFSQGYLPKIRKPTEEELKPAPPGLAKLLENMPKYCGKKKVKHPRSLLKKDKEEMYAEQEKRAAQKFEEAKKRIQKSKMKDQLKKKAKEEQLVDIRSQIHNELKQEMQ